MENNDMNWGKGIITGMALFVLFITCMGIYMFMQPDDYDKQYYEKGLTYDKDFGKEKRVIAEHVQPAISLNDAALIIGFQSPAKGQVHCFRPSDRRLDKTFELATDNGNRFTAPLSQFTTGQWQLEIDWTNQGKEYLYKQELFIP